MAGLHCEPMTAMQFARYAVGYLPETGRGSNLVLAVSVSGAVSRTVDAMALARQAGATAVALTGNPEGPLGQAAELVTEVWHDADQFVFCGAGPNYGTALFNAAKILEASGDTAVPTRECFSPLLTCLPGTLFAAYRTQFLGEPYFRGFGGGHSVEGGGGISRIRDSEQIDKVRR